jgi:serine/threonine protein kinase
MPAAQTVPCQVHSIFVYQCNLRLLIDRLLSFGKYRTGKTLGSGTYAVVKEAVHIKTGKYYACKVINKKLMEGREHMVRYASPSLERQPLY